ncbi:hypothetical protein SCLARK_00843 [Spiroplasma clarkii]|uniref:GTP cyclohydrolase 1 type 2 homolog n=1 Tax=Spiroplasma clarkii TaxID=2139 RepID=A0A1Y0L156_9MOLU|nr:Nif3-like dinuclear metal center hexameric protein [Spiroplasma clarkii]ARU91458.1 hypothetical protein SCLARK_00843 [Spiroplasma clarkii]ATX70881.1 hypothetical protein SCLAR_v1c05620 [Spiroplasma clarkii]
MSKVNTNSLINYLNDLFPQTHAAEWDTVGLQIEEVYNLPSQDEISAVVVCLDVTKDVVEKAITTKANFIISRHPFFFGDINEELQNPAKKEVYDALIAHEIQVFSIHTNYDNSESNNLIDLLETRFNIKKYEVVGENQEGYKIEFLREIALSEIVENMKLIFGQEQLALSVNSDLNKLVRKIYLTPGSGSDTMSHLKLQNAVFVTGEVKWHEWLYADQNHVDLLTLGHYMENHFIDDIRNKLYKTFTDIVVYDYDIKNLFKVV